MPTFCLKLLQLQTLQSVMVIEGAKAGFGKAQLRGMVTNLQVWSRRSGCPLMSTMQHAPFIPGVA